MNLKPIYNLIKGCIVGIALIIGAFWIMYYMAKVNPYYEFLLITRSQTTNGFITHSEEVEDVAEQENGNDKVFYDVYFNYTFNTKKGEIINDHSSEASSEEGYLNSANYHPIPIEVEYLPNNPKINRIKGMTGQATSISEFIWRRAGLGLFLLLSFSSIGFIIITKSIKEYKKTLKKSAS